MAYKVILRKINKNNTVFTNKPIQKWLVISLWYTLILVGSVGIEKRREQGKASEISRAGGVKGKL